MAAGKGVVHITDENLETVLKNSVVLVDFWAPWCGPCRMQGPILEEVEKLVGDKAVIGKINVDENPEAASRFGIVSIPTLHVFKGGAPYKQFVGVQQKDTLVKTIESALS
jgi:thioredoxin 1